jgi:hypothetical protein
VKTVTRANRKKHSGPLNCPPEAAESCAQASDPQRRISVLIAEHTGSIWADTDLLRTDLLKKDKKAGLANAVR